MSMFHKCEMEDLYYAMNELLKECESKQEFIECLMMVLDRFLRYEVVSE